jgi:hypothetical protein
MSTRVSSRSAALPRTSCWASRTTSCAIRHAAGSLRRPPANAGGRAALDRDGQEPPQERRFLLGRGELGAGQGSGARGRLHVGGHRRPPAWSRPSPASARWPAPPAATPTAPGAPTASRAQGGELGEVNTAMAALDAITRQNAALVEQSAAASNNVAGEAARLSQAWRYLNSGKRASRLPCSVIAGQPPGRPHIVGPRPPPSSFSIRSWHGTQVLAVGVASRRCSGISQPQDSQMP